MMRQRIHKLALLSLSLSFIGILIIIFAILFEESPVEYKNVPVATPSQVKAGETFYMDFEVCATRLSSLSWTEHFVESETKKETWLPGGVSSAQKGCITYPNVPKKVPDNLELGTYTLVYDITVQGRFKNHLLIIRTDFFEVIE